LVPVEVCRDIELRGLWSSIQNLLDRASSQMADPQKLRWNQEAWLRRLEQDCGYGGRFCLREHLKVRIAELRKRIGSLKQGNPSSQAYGRRTARTGPNLNPLPRTPLLRRQVRTQTRSLTTPPLPRFEVLRRLKNLEYTIDGKRYRLRNGRYHNRAQWAYVDFGRILTSGDMNGDGRTDYVVSVYFNGGGSGIFPHLFVVSQRGGNFVSSSPADLPDRSDIHSAVIRDGKLYLSLTEPGPHDPACCPSLHRTRVYRMKDHRLIRIR
jgi:hypothetical protein